MKKTSEDRYANRLDADGSNLAAMFRFLSDSQPSVKERLLEFLRAAIEGVADVRCEPFGRGIELRFDTQRVGNESATLWRPGEPDGSNGPLHRASGTSFYASQMSDGTLRTLGMLVAVFGAAQSRPPVSFVSIEEPETALHPHATAVLVDAFREVSRQTQVVITTHSPCLLDDLDPDLDGILVAQSIDGQTRMGPIDAASRETIRQGLFSAGQLLDMNQLEPSHIAQSTGA